MRTQRKRSLFRHAAVAFSAVACIDRPTGTDGPVIVADAAAVPSPAANLPILCKLKDIDYRYFVAGGVCAAWSHGITTPIDVVKTRMQAQPKKYNKGVSSAAVFIVREDGPGALLGGLGPTIAGYGIEGAMKFGVYELMKPVMSKLMKGENTAVAYVAASIVAGAIASILLCPMESARIRIVTDPSYADLGLFTGLPKLVREDGFWSTFSGVYAMLAKQVPYTMAKQVSFDIVAGLLYAAVANANLSKEDMKWVVSICAAFVASLFACIFSQPGDMILTETYRGKQSDKGFWGVVSDIFNTKGGLAGFFTGTGARIVHVGAIITSQLVVYDIVKQLLGLPATGSH